MENNSCLFDINQIFIHLLEKLIFFTSQNTEYRIYFQFPIYIYDTIQHNDRIYNR